MMLKNVKIKEVDAVLRYATKSNGWKAHNRVNHIIGVQVRGEYEHVFNHTKFTLKPNSVFFFNKQDDYSVTTFLRGEAFSIHFTTIEPIDVKSFCINLKNASEFISLFEKMERAWQIGESENLVLSYLYRFIYNVEKLSDKYSKFDTRISEAREFIDLNYKQKDCITKATEQSGITRRRFNELFKNQLNVTPNRYLVIKRISHAKEMLKAGYMTILEIALNCGFANEYYFSSAFKQETGLTPTEYKKSVMIANKE